MCFINIYCYPIAATRLSSSDYSAINSILKEHAARWRDIGGALGFRQGELDNIQSSPMLMMQAPGSWLGQMLTQWLEWAPGDGRDSTGFATKKALHVALLETNLGQLAQQFSE